ncbi:hypothetical protein LDENG_00240540 [Lucifuga dentata]|nr:hypothetical protein LDENG_00240540 [Lucifuga dentata]
MIVSNVTCMKIEYIRLKHAKWVVWSFQAYDLKAPSLNVHCRLAVSPCFQSFCRARLILKLHSSKEFAIVIVLRVCACVCVCVCVRNSDMYSSR